LGCHAFSLSKLVSQVKTKFKSDHLHKHSASQVFTIISQNRARLRQRMIDIAGGFAAPFHFSSTRYCYVG